MVSSQVTIINPTGLHARPASEFVAKAKQFQSRIMIQNVADASAAPVNAKSIVLLLTLGLTQGSVAQITAEGADEKEALEALTQLVASGLGE
jgi:phosphocarrier protein